SSPPATAAPAAKPRKPGDGMRESLRQLREKGRDHAAKVRGSVSDYLARGWRVLPVPHKAKGPNKEGWQELRITVEELDDHFPADHPLNVGLLLGEPSRGLVDVDLD